MSIPFPSCAPTSSGSSGSGGADEDLRITVEDILGPEMHDHTRKVKKDVCLFLLP